MENDPLAEVVLKPVLLPLLVVKFTPTFGTGAPAGVRTTPLKVTVVPPSETSTVVSRLIVGRLNEVPSRSALLAKRADLKN